MKYLAALLLLILSLSLSAAEIVCTTYPIWLLTRSLTHETGLTVDLMTPEHGGCAHNYTPLPGDLVKVKAPGTILIAHGLKVDDHLISAACRANKQLKVVQVGYPAKDAHSFASPDTAFFILIKAAAELIEIYPEKAPQIKKNLEYMLFHTAKLVERAKNLKSSGKTVVLQHKIFINMATLCKVEFMLLKPEQSATVRPRDLMDLVRSARKKRVNVICAESHNHDPAVKLFARESKSRIVELDMLTGGSLQVPFDYYVKVMTSNLDKLESVFQ